MCAILGAEYLLRWLPRGTHSWQKFVKPSEIARSFDRMGIKIQDMMGMKFNPLNKQWGLSLDLSVNYIIAGMKH
jgi:2-polyprenyl-6-hydroxyphenyl methylase/3-demethylubiquinone-9 3-methyltransferase